MTLHTIGLRERKHIETRKTLEIETVALVLRDGLEQASIEAICERANVSPRTFFNYFESKEEALLGLHLLDISDDMIVKHSQADSGKGVAQSVVALMIDVITPALSDSELYKSRLQVLRLYPQILESQMTRKMHMAKQLASTVHRVACAISREPFDEAQSEALFALCMSAVRVSLREGTQTGSKLSPIKLERRALQIINEVTKKI